MIKGSTPRTMVLLENLIAAKAFEAKVVNKDEVIPIGSFPLIYGPSMRKLLPRHTVLGGRLNPLAGTDDRSSHTAWT